MRVPKLLLAASAAASAIALSGCAEDMYGPYGYGYTPYGGYGAYGYGYPYGGYGYGYGYGAYYDPFGWYGDFYYPGAGIFVFDGDRHRHVWDDNQRRFWENRRTSWQSRTGHTWTGGQNWSGWRNRSGSTGSTMGTNTGGWHHHHD
jgi:hypothetical protein